MTKKIITLLALTSLFTFACSPEESNTEDTNTQTEQAENTDATTSTEATEEGFTLPEGWKEVQSDDLKIKFALPGDWKPIESELKKEAELPHYIAMNESETMMVMLFLFPEAKASSSEEIAKEMFGMLKETIKVDSLKMEDSSTTEDVDGFTNWSNVNGSYTTDKGDFSVVAAGAKGKDGYPYSLGFAVYYLHSEVNEKTETDIINSIQLIK